MRDDDVRSSCFASLDVLLAKHGPDVPYEALGEGFNFRGRRVPFLNRAYGIYRSAAQRGPAALSVNSSFRQDRYRDEPTPDGVLYAYHGTDPDTHYNRWLRSAHTLDVPLVYFVGTRPNWYLPIYPTYVKEDRPAELRVLLSFGRMRGPYDEREPVHASARFTTVRSTRISSGLHRICASIFIAGSSTTRTVRCSIC